MFNLTGRVLDLGLIGLSQFLPFLCLSLFAGHAADHFDRKLIVALCLATFLVCAFLLFFLHWAAYERRCRSLRFSPFWALRGRS